MSTSIISARIEDDVKDCVARYLQAAGLGVGDVIKIVWDTIARTGEIPRPLEPEDAASKQAERLEAFAKLRASLPPCPELASMTETDMRACIAQRYETPLEEAVTHAR